jgi:hypothetical protein
MQNQESVCLADDLLSQADIILPSQYFASMGSAGLSGEQRLMLAVLVDAINVLQSWKGTGSPHKRRNYAEAVRWVNTPGAAHPFSFDCVCDALEIDSELLRSRLRGLTVPPARLSRRVSLARLRRKELSRRHQVTVNRARRRAHFSAGQTLSLEGSTESPSTWSARAEEIQDRTISVSVPTTNLIAQSET